MSRTPMGAEYPDMPLSAINAVQVDAVLSPEDLAREILKFQRSGKLGVSDDRFMTPVQFDALCQIVNDRTGSHFSHYKSSVVARRVRRRMYLQGIDAVDDYLRLLGRKEQEASRPRLRYPDRGHLLFQRPAGMEGPSLEATRKLVVEDDKTPIRVWAAACATGEEAYSIAMMLQRELDAAGRKREFQVFATDVSEQAMQTGAGGNVSGQHLGRSPSRVPPKILFLLCGGPFRYGEQRDTAARDIRQTRPPRRPSLFPAGPYNMPQSPDLPRCRRPGEVHLRLPLRPQERRLPLSRQCRVAGQDGRSLCDACPQEMPHLPKG